MFQTIDQILDGNTFQLGTSQQPCQVLFGMASRFDEGKLYKTIKATCPEMCLFRDYDMESELHPLVKQWDDTAYVSLKVRADDPTLSLLTRGCCFLVIVTARKWKMNGKRGVSLYAEAIKITNRPLPTYQFIE